MTIRCMGVQDSTNRQVAVDFQTVTGKVYSVEWSEDFTAWAPTPISLPGTGGVMTFFGDVVDPDDPMFYRLAVTDALPEL